LQFRKIIAIFAAGLACSAALLASTTTQKKKSAPAKHAAASAARKPAPSRGAKHKPAARAAHSTKATHTAWHPGQTAPTPERYKEIQEALAKKGYLHGEASGAWNQDSSDALRRFQQDQNLQASGKLDSLSIIALGLGPKY
jgi:peptidoglycan hydrolase-like protein with peptidoglycan-binding domain